jgi:TatD DNase family protein
MQSDDANSYYFIDTHAHLDMLKQMTPEFAVKESLREGVRYIINVGSSLSGSKKAAEYADKFDNVYSSAGIHPHYAKGFNNDKIRRLEEIIAGNKKTVAVGETGFDYFRNLSPKEDQRRAFTAQIELALRNELPLIIHDRDAHEDILDVLRGYSQEKKFRAVVHCFSGGPEFAEKCLDLGFFISFTGVITFPNAKNLIDTVRVVPLEKMFLETDAPFLAPQQKRGKENYPGYLKFIASKIAGIKELDVKEVAGVTSRNAEKFFNLK